MKHTCEYSILIYLASLCAINMDRMLILNVELKLAKIKINYSLK